MPIDYLRLMFENYFKLAELVVKKEEVIDKQRILSAIHGGWSGVDRNDKMREKTLEQLIKDLPMMLEVANIIQSDAASDAGNDGQTLTRNREKSEWMTLDEVCKEFNLSKTKVKDKKWRDNNNFPYHQAGKRSSVNYSRSEIEKWMDEH